VVYEPVLGMENVLIIGVLKKVLTGNGVAGVILEGLNTHRWGASIPFIE
jgi:hypothetical protein